MTRRNTNGRSAFLQLLIDEGVTHLFGNPGTTELAIMEAVPHFPELKYVLGLQESVVVGMADGYARASNALAACNLHCTPGLGHAMGALYNAKFSGSPLIVTAGQYEQGYGLQEPMLYEPLMPIAAPLVKWATEVPRVEDLPRIVHRAAKIALTPPTGPVFISLPGDILDDEGELDLGSPTRVERDVRPSDELVQRLADRLLAASHPVIIAGRELANRDAFAEAAALAEVLGAAVYHEPVPYNARFPSAHPAFMGDLTRSQPKVRETLERYDLLICLGADLLRMSPFSAVDPLPDGMPVIHISERDAELGKNYSTAMAICADVKATLGALLPIVRGKRTPDRAGQAADRLKQLAESNWSTQRLVALKQVQSAAGATPIDPRYLMMCVADALPQDAIVVEEAVTAAAALSTFLDVRGPKSFYGLASGGLGFALPGAIGVSLAQPGRPVVAVVGDGSAMYTIQALWTAAHLGLPITYLIVNNRCYRIIKDRLVSLRHSERFVGMDLTQPDIDFVGVAQGLGMAARRVTRPADVEAVLRDAFASGVPNLIEVVVDAGEYGKA
jgi:benzoylformate decarboxylase